MRIIPTIAEPHNAEGIYGYVCTQSCEPNKYISFVFPEKKCRGRFLNYIFFAFSIMHKVNTVLTTRAYTWI